MKIADKSVLITGANRGIGRALVDEAVSRGAKRVYAATRQPFSHPSPRVTSLTLDITNAAHIQEAVKKVELRRTPADRGAASRSSSVARR